MVGREQCAAIESFDLVVALKFGVVAGNYKSFVPRIPELLAHANLPAEWWRPIFIRDSEAGADGAHLTILPCFSPAFHCYT